MRALKKSKVGLNVICSRYYSLRLGVKCLNVKAINTARIFIRHDYAGIVGILKRKKNPVRTVFTIVFASTLTACVTYVQPPAESVSSPSSAGIIPNTSPNDPQSICSNIRELGLNIVKARDAGVPREKLRRINVGGPEALYGLVQAMIGAAFDNPKLSASTLSGLFEDLCLDTVRQKMG
jgi:hypothetical protein